MSIVITFWWRPSPGVVDQYENHRRTVLLFVSPTRFVAWAAMMDELMMDELSSAG